MAQRFDENLHILRAWFLLIAALLVVLVYSIMDSAVAGDYMV